MRRNYNRLPAETAANSVERNNCIFSVGRYEEGLVIDWKEPTIVKSSEKHSVLKREAFAASKFAGTIAVGEVAINVLDTQLDLTRPSTLILTGLLAGYAGYNYLDDSTIKRKNTREINRGIAEKKFIIYQDKLNRSRQMESALLIPSVNIDRTFIRPEEMPHEYGAGETKLPFEKLSNIISANSKYESIGFQNISASSLEYERQRTVANIESLEEFSYNRMGRSFDGYDDDFIDYYEKPLKKARKKLENIEAMKLYINEERSSGINLIAIEDLRPDILLHEILSKMDKEERDIFISSILNDLLNLQTNIDKFTILEKDIDYSENIMSQLDEKGREECNDILAELNKQQYDVTKDILESMLNILAEKHLQEENKKRIALMSELDELKNRLQDNMGANDYAIISQADRIAVESRIRTLDSQLNSNL